MYECPSLSTVCCATITVSQAEQCEPSVRPVFSQSGTTALSVTTVSWLAASSASVTSLVAPQPHFIVTLPAVLQVEGTLEFSTSVT